jgi:hypothetical protein
MRAMSNHHHGSTPAAWTGVAIAFVGFIVGCIAVIQLNWTLLAVGFVLLVLAMVVGKVMQMMGLGAQPERWADTPTGTAAEEAPAP